VIIQSTVIIQYTVIISISRRQLYLTFLPKNLVIDLTRCVMNAYLHYTGKALVSHANSHALALKYRSPASRYYAI
jgi:hypothetical protein